MHGDQPDASPHPSASAIRPAPERATANNAGTVPGTAPTCTRRAQLTGRPIADHHEARNRAPCDHSRRIAQDCALSGCDAASSWTTYINTRSRNLDSIHLSAAVSLGRLHCTTSPSCCYGPASSHLPNRRLVYRHHRGQPANHSSQRARVKQQLPLRERLAPRSLTTLVADPCALAATATSVCPSC